MGAYGFKALKRFAGAVDVVLQLTAREPQLCGIQEDRGDARINQGGIQPAHAGYLKGVDQVTGREHGAAFVVGGVDKVHGDFSRGKGDTVQLKITGFLNLPLGDGDSVDDGFTDVRLPNSHFNNAIFGNALRGQHALRDRKGAHRGRQIAAVAAPVHKGLVNGHLTEEVIHIVSGPLAGAHDDGFARA